MTVKICLKGEKFFAKILTYIALVCIKKLVLEVEVNFIEANL